jgi:uncharacterized membrane protein
MDKGKMSFKANVIYGVIVLVPIGIIALLAAQIVGTLAKYGKELGLQTTLGVLLALVLAVLALLFLCYAIGALVRTKIGSISLEKMEGTILKQVPGYQFIKNLLTGFAETKAAYPAALVQLNQEGVSVIGFVMEEHPNDTATVFVPLAPMVSLGNIYVVENERINYLDASALDVTGCLAQWGIGSNEFVGK